MPVRILTDSPSVGAVSPAVEETGCLQFQYCLHLELMPVWHRVPQATKGSLPVLRFGCIIAQDYEFGGMDALWNQTAESARGQS
jgi:hypothetical protein